MKKNIRLQLRLQRDGILQFTVTIKPNEIRDKRDDIAGFHTFLNISRYR